VTCLLQSTFFLCTFKLIEQINRFKKQQFLNRFEQNNQFKKCTHRASPKNSTLQKASQKKKKLQGKKQNSPMLQSVSTYLP
jgi:hypothetical protein